jgi:hypothetical protein
VVAGEDRGRQNSLAPVTRNTVEDRLDASKKKDAQTRFENRDQNSSGTDDRENLEHPVDTQDH